MINLKNIFSKDKQDKQHPTYTQEMLLALKDKKQIKNITVNLALQTDMLTKKDIESWRMAWQSAINVLYPRRNALYDIYADSLVDEHLSGCIEQRKNMVLKKAFRILDKDFKENKELTYIFNTMWFKDFCNYVLDSRYWGHSLIEFGDTINNGFSYCHLVPRKHVCPEFGVILKNRNDDPKYGIPYREGELTQWIIEAGDEHDLGLLLKCAPSTISKRHMLAFWDGFGEVFGTPIRIATTTSRDKEEQAKIENMMDSMGALSWGVFPEGTEVKFVESSRGDAFNVYDKRIDRANSEMSKCILNQTMTIDSGSSLSQSEVHLEIFNNVIEKDANFLCDIINDRLIPMMINHGFPLENYRFSWDDTHQYTPQEMKDIEQMLLSAGYDIDVKYFVEKYNIPILGKKEQQDFFA
jgi:hypothetical protein